MELAVRPEPPLLDDKTQVVPVPDDEIGGGSSDLMVLSTDSLFALYQRNLAATAAPSGAAPEQAPPETPAAPARDVPPAPAPLAAPPVSSASRPSPLAEPPGAAAPASPAGTPSKGAEQPVAIRSNPPGAVVRVDDILNCAAPCEVPLAPGRHTLRATLAGHRDALKIFNVDKGKTEAVVEVALDAKRGWLNVETDIPGAPVFLDGKRTDKRTPARFTLDEGTYEVGVEIDSHLSSQKVAITDNGIVRLKF
jgi:hypothetical protein